MKEDDDDKAEDENGEGDPFWFCGPPSSVLVKRDEEGLAREKENSYMELEVTKLENFERKETAEIKMKEKMVTVRNQEEGVDIINEGDWGACGPCFKGWVHFCPEDIFAC